MGALSPDPSAATAGWKQGLSWKQGNGKVSFQKDCRPMFYQLRGWVIHRQVMKSIKYL